MAAIAKLADTWPASITAVAGTVAAAVSLLDSAMVIGALAGLAIETVPIVASLPAASLTLDWASASPSVGILSSITTALSAPATKPADSAVIVAVTLPSIMSSFIAVTGN